MTQLQQVRVCDACYDKVSRPPTSSAKLEIVDTANDYGPTQPQVSELNVNCLLLSYMVKK